MNNGIYSAATSLTSLQKWQESVAGNIAASSVPGFKGNQVSFQSIQSGVMGVQSSGRVHETPNQMAIASASIDLGHGALNQTGGDLHMAIHGDGFFRMRGDGFEYFTRDGEFRLDANNQVVNKRGEPLLGENGGPLRINPELGPVTINEEGYLIQGMERVGRIAVMNIEDPRELLRIPGGFRLDPDTEVRPVENPKARIVQGSLEESNISPIREMVNLISISRAFELNHKVIQSLDDIQGKTIEVMGAT